MTDLTVFWFESDDVRFVEDKPFAYDVAKALKYKDPVKTTATLVDPEYKIIKEVEIGGEIEYVTVLEEAGIYQLIFQSELQLSAKVFQEWMFKEVLPSIRETGEYDIKPKTALELARELVSLLEYIEKLEKEQLEQENNQLAEALDELFGYSSITRVAKYNNCTELNFNWRILKGYSQQMEEEIKKLGEKNLYSHNVWRVAYPGYDLPD